MDITIIGVEITDENGLGPCYRITQHTDHGVELYILPRSAIAADMELYNVDDPVQVLDWRLHGYRGTPQPPGAIAPSLTKAAQAQDLQIITAYDRARLAADPTATDAADDLDQAEADITAFKAEACQLRDAEITAIKTSVHIADDDGLAALRALVSGDATAIHTDREHYCEQIAQSLLITD